MQPFEHLEADYRGTGLTVGNPHAELLRGYDADPPGERAALALSRNHPQLRQLRPPGARDWNDLLRLRVPR